MARLLHTAAIAAFLSVLCLGHRGLGQGHECDDESCEQRAATQEEAALLQLRRGEKETASRQQYTSLALDSAELEGMQFRLISSKGKGKDRRPVRWNAATPNELEELKNPRAVRQPHDGPLILQVESVILSTPFIRKGSYVNTRGYNGSVPGPMIVMTPGDTLKLRVVNTLGPNTDSSDFCAYEHHELPERLRKLEGVGPRSEHICELNTTNFHTHGLHTSPLFGGDEVRRTRIEPNTSMDFSFEIPDYHMGGSHWYHPHVHTSTAVQAGGGLHGFIHVEDLPGTIPLCIEKMESTWLYISGIDMELSTKFEMLGSAKKENSSIPPYGFWVWHPCGGPDEPEPDPDEDEGEEQGEADCEPVDPLTEEGLAFWDKIGYKKNPQMLVNGQYQPKISLHGGEWRRLRLAHASYELTLHVGLADPQMCKAGLIAKDGVYLEEGPRWLKGPITLSVASRADVIISCTCPKGVESCGTWLMYQLAHHENHPERRDMLVYLHVRQNKYDDPRKLRKDIWSYYLRRPCYMADLRGMSVEPENVHQLSLPCDFQPRCGKYNVTYDGVSHTTPSTALIDHLELGTLYEWNFFHGLQYHPIHLHVTPFQIIEIGPHYTPFYMTFEDDEWKYSNFFQEGDWHDTLRMPHRESAVLRMLPNSFTGDYMFHCHFLDHEDAGLMGFFAVHGREGTRNEDAQQHDPLCYWDLQDAGYRYGKLPSKYRWQY